MVSDRPDHDVDAFTNALGEMGDMVDDAILNAYKNKEGFTRTLRLGKVEPKVIYSAWDCDGDEVPPNNLNDIPFKGTFVVVADYESFWDVKGDGEAYIAGPVTNPTWLELAILANEAIHVTGDEHHVFFEGVDLVDDGKALKLYFGS
jgi:hypothetical protein